MGWTGPDQNHPSRFSCVFCRFHGAELQGAVGFLGPASSAAVFLIAVAEVVLHFLLVPLMGVSLIVGERVV